MAKSSGSTPSLSVEVFEAKGKRGRKKSPVRDWAEEFAPVLVAEGHPKGSFLPVPVELTEGLSPVNVRANVASALKAMNLDRDLRAGESKSGRVGIVVR